MEKEFVKGCCKRLLVIALICIVYLAIRIFLSLKNNEISPTVYMVEGGTVGMLLGCIYARLYIKQKTSLGLILASLVAIPLYIGFGLLFTGALTDVDYLLGLLFMVLGFGVLYCIAQKAGSCAEFMRTVERHTEELNEITRNKADK